MEFLLKIKKSDMKQYDKDNNATVPICLAKN